MWPRPLGPSRASKEAKVPEQDECKQKTCRNNEIPPPKPEPVVADSKKIAKGKKP